MDICLRHRWMGLKMLRHPHVFPSLSFRTVEGRRSQFCHRAQEAARYLARVIWGDIASHPLGPARPCIRPPLSISENEFSMDEFKLA
eukprot:7015099-Prorocentrum_lima.AAC.1